jgi:hypothetical protein
LLLSGCAGAATQPEIAIATDESQNSQPPVAGLSLRRAKPGLLTNTEFEGIRARLRV